MIYHDLNNHGLRVINFSHVFTIAYKDIVKDLYTYDVFHDHNVRSQDTKRIYYYHLIKHMCDFVVNTNTTNRLVVYFSHKDIKCDFKQCTNKQTRHSGKADNRPQFILFMERFFKQLKNVLPIKVFISPVKFETFIQYYNTNKGKYVEMINQMKQAKNTTTNMEKFKKFSEKYKLNYLTKHYVDNIRVKCMIYK